MPYIYVPFNISGSVEFDDVSQDFELGPSEIQESLSDSTFNFGFLGEIEAWTPNYTVGILGNVDYISVSSESTIDVPSEIEVNLDTQLLSLDLAAGYRFYDRSQANPEGLQSEFDLGPLVFDVRAGANLISLSTDLDLRTNQGEGGESSNTHTVISPLIG